MLGDFHHTRRVAYFHNPRTLIRIYSTLSYLSMKIIWVMGYVQIKSSIWSFKMIKVNENSPETQNIFSPNVSGRLANLINCGRLKETVPVTLSVLRDDADQDGSFLLIDSASTGNFHRKPKSEPDVPLPVSVIRRVFFCLTLLFTYTINYLSLEQSCYKRRLIGGCN